MGLAYKVKTIRTALGWKQAKLADKSGVPQATISRIESGKILNPSLNHLIGLADALDVSLDLLTGRLDG